MKREAYAVALTMLAVVFVPIFRAFLERWKRGQVHISVSAQANGPRPDGTDRFTDDAASEITAAPQSRENVYCRSFLFRYSDGSTAFAISSNCARPPRNALTRSASRSGCSRSSL